MANLRIFMRASRQLLSLFFLLSCGMTMHAQHAVVESTLDSAAIRVGEQVMLHLKVSVPAQSRVQFPDYKQGYLTQGVEMLEASKIDTTVLNDGKLWQLTRSYLLTSFDSAVYQIPQQVVAVNGKTFRSRQQLALKVNTIKVDLGHPDEIKPAKAPIEGVFVWTFLLLGCVVLLWGLVFLLIFVLRQSFVPQALQKIVKVKAPAPPHRVAMEAMNELGKPEAQDSEKQKAYFVQLTDILRTYLDERFGFNAREMTSHEIITALQQVNDASALRELQEILQTADLVKFARHEVSMAESDRALLQAVDYVRTTQSQETTPEYEEKVVDIEKRVILRKRRMFSAAITCLIICVLALFSYICYLLWTFLP